MSSPYRDLPALVLGAALVVAALVACSGDAGRLLPGDAPGRGVYVPLAWQTARAIGNHRVHVAREHVACSRCHELTQDSMGAVTPARCAECHAKEARFEHASARAKERFGPEAKTDCTTCHLFTVDGTEQTAKLAHELEPPHTIGTIAPHPPTAPGTAGHVPGATECKRCHADRQGDTPAVTVHGTSECVKCHKPHEDVKRSIGPCPECHQKITTQHATSGKAPSEACVTCHAHQHAPASDALGGCVSCHETHEPKVPKTALFGDGHRECVGCHRPHDFTKQSAKPCRACHEDVRVLGAPRVAAHEQCQSCHTPHDVRGANDAVCAKCHQNVHPDHPQVGGKTCTGCHDPHPTAAQSHTHARTCSGCHQQAGSDTELHGGTACQKCHAPHDFGIHLTDHALCQSCHQKQVALTATLSGHQTCEGCHRALPHHPERLEASCETCHASVQHAARPGHSQCKSCHEPHGGGLVAECKTCHAAEQRTAPVGHSTCTNCHDQHTGSAAAKPCASCHAKEATSPHGKLAEGCTSCHRPHGPAGRAVPPPCTSCHEPTKLPGLHAVQKHQECTQCHQPHQSGDVATRATCLTCHADRKDHFPDAATCGSCHLFGPVK